MNVFSLVKGPMRWKVTGHAGAKENNGWIWIGLKRRRREKLGLEYSIHLTLIYMSGSLYAKISRGIKEWNGITRTGWSQDSRVESLSQIVHSRARADDDAAVETRRRQAAKQVRIFTYWPS